MKRHFSRRYTLILCLLLLGGGFYLYNLIPHNQKNLYTYIPSAGNDSGASDDSGSSGMTNPAGSTDDHPAGSDSIPSAPPVPTTVSQKTEASIQVRGAEISLGESEDSVVQKLGAPSRIEETEYYFEYYVYNNDYRRLLFVAVGNEKVVGYYTDSLDFDYMGIRSGSDLKAVSKVFSQNLTMSEILQQATDDYTVRVLMDTLESQKVTGIYVLSKSVQTDTYTKEAMKNTELLVYDLVNSIRLRNGIPVLSWSSSAAKASRKHSFDMAGNHFFGHINPKRETPGDRLRAQGIFFKTNSENIIAGYGTAVLSVHKLYNSQTQRNNMLNKKFRYLGVGFAYVSDSTYQTYFTQNYYR